MEFSSACTGCVRGSKSVRELVSTAAESSGVYGFIELSGLSRDSSCRKPLEEKTCISHHLHYLKQVKNCCTILVEFVMLFELVMLPFIWMAVSSGKAEKARAFVSVRHASNGYISWRQYVQLYTQMYQEKNCSFHFGQL